MNCGSDSALGKSGERGLVIFIWAYEKLWMGQTEEGEKHDGEKDTTGGKVEANYPIGEASVAQDYQRSDPQSVAQKHNLPGDQTFMFSLASGPRPRADHAFSEM
jgi:hypothetical protein